MDLQTTIDILLENRYFDVATSKSGSPWITPVYYGLDSELRFYIVSKKESRHSKYIQENSEVAAGI